MQTTEQKRAYEKRRNQLPHRRAARRDYQKTEQGKAAHLRANREWRRRNKDKVKAHNAVARALESGKLIRPEYCEGCFQPCVTEAHHEDYSLLLDVVWLCEDCHKEEHRDR